MGGRRAVASAAVLVVLVAGCGSSSDDGADSERTTTTRAATDATVADLERELGAAVHYAGFRLLVETLTVKDGVAVVSGRAENVGVDSAEPPQRVTVDLDGQEVPLDLSASALSTVPGESTGRFSYGFRVPPGTDLDDATLLVGSAGTARAEVPLGDRGVLVANDPIAVVVVGGEVVAGDSTFQVDGAEVRFDVPDDHVAAEAGQAFLTVAFTVTNNDQFPGGYAFVRDDVRLETPSGITLAPDVSPIELLRPGASLPDLLARWTIDVDEPGTYVFVGLRDVGTDEQTEGRLEFRVGPLAG